MISVVTRAVILLPLLCMSARAVAQERLPPKVSDFIQLLVRANQPTLAEFAKYGGECGGESELKFALNICRTNGWGINTKPCVDFTRQRCREAEREPSLELSWLRDQFSTIGKSYKLISLQSESEDIDLIEIEIGKNRFLLFHSTNPYPPGGLVVGISKVNGKSISDYLEGE